MVLNLVLSVALKVTVESGEIQAVAQSERAHHVLSAKVYEASIDVQFTMKESAKDMNRQQGLLEVVGASDDDFASGEYRKSDERTERAEGDRREFGRTVSAFESDSERRE